MRWTLTEKERFWQKVDPCRTDGCWAWIAAVGVNGYGYFWTEKRVRTAHRWAYESIHGAIPVGHEPDHLCRVRSCVNPDHLEVVTKANNLLRGISPPAMNARKTHCPQGHPYDESNTRVTPYGFRICRKCHSQRTVVTKKTVKVSVKKGRG